ncbi:uncharacterized protein E0L32_000730 [Thyridium curvatum]|uniref:Oxidoreductase-like protein n=1 Tax=Thyridium curvatum TaxID=1093900 RepID=A0A507AY39_9PEZI|nr:uncharacterized protein E0L32_000730 [Thyridium curvatum]TPX12553.1 hypothetical protein E0L32_000730 [Thyridium curvatum]
MPAEQQQVEARSLAAINYLAANPPQYPVNPTEEKQEPLTLYISRVPGTRDVILSTLKPQRKNVTAEDVANSLYYIHLDQPADDHLLASDATRDQHSPRASGEMAREPPPPVTTIQRKPVPSAAAAAATKLPQPETPAPEAATQDAPIEPAPPTPPPKQDDGVPIPESSNLVPPGFKLERGPSMDGISDPSAPNLPPRPPPGYVAPIPRKPLGPRAMNAPAILDPEAAQNAPPPLSAAADSHGAQSSSFAPPRTLSPSKPYTQSPLGFATPRSPSPSKALPFTLTLIRRDRAAGHQWNVGKISSYQLNEPLPPASQHHDERGGGGGHHHHHADPPPPNALQAAKQPTINIHIETSGYAKFRGFPALTQSLDQLKLSLDSSASSSAAAAAAAAPGQPRLNAKNVEDLLAAAAAAASGGNSSSNNAFSWSAEEGFARQVAMAYTKSWSSNFKDALHRRGRSSSLDGPGGGSADENPSSSSPQRQQQQQRHGRHGSVASTGSAEDGGGGGGGGGAVADDGSNMLITRPGPGLKPKGYFFASPWDGRCEFRTGNGGRSLKCRHVMGSASGGAGGGGGGGMNPLVFAQGLRDGQSLSAAATGGRARGGSLSSVITGAVAVSELRFNLPSAEIFKTRKDPREPLSRFEKFLKLDQTAGGRRMMTAGGGGAGAHGRSSSEDDGWGAGESFSEEVVEDDGAGGGIGGIGDLGREKAGGGNRGKRAKLGKLIVYDEGLKMLDLVVAANMGIWWGAWERSF